MTLVQLNIFNEREIITPQSSNSYENFVKKFERKKTTDDCYTPPRVYDAVLQYVENYILNPDGDSVKNYNVLRPFKSGGDYLKENYDDKTLVIDNPPFSLYSKIVRNYLNMKVKFFLFAPALTLFVINSVCQYVITNSNIKYENGAIVRTSFATNLLPLNYKIILSGRLSGMIKEAQNFNNKKNALVMPAGYLSSAQLLKFVPGHGADITLTGSEEFLTKVNKTKIFGSAIKLSEEDLKKIGGV